MKAIKTHIFFNPFSAGGRTGKAQQEVMRIFEKYFGKDYTFSYTEKQPGDKHLMDKFLDNGYESIIAVGGDGTIHHVVNQLFQKEEYTKKIKLGIISSGTGKGFAESLSLPESIEKQISRIKNGEAYFTDIGKIEYNLNKNTVTRYFVNEFQLGIGGEVVKRVNQEQKRFNGRLAIPFGTISSILLYPNQSLSIKINGESVESTFTGAIIANGAFTGGGMNIAPFAKLNDGLLDVILIKGQNAFERLLNFSKIYSGRYINSKKILYKQSKEIFIDSKENIPMEADGELLSGLPCKISIIEKAIKVYN